jgi:hypothetical protein
MEAPFQEDNTDKNFNMKHEMFRSMATSTLQEAMREGRFDSKLLASIL